MGRWADLVEAEPAFAAEVGALFDAGRHKVLATLRKDGSPRLSGIEVNFLDGDVWFGCMAASRKRHDLVRDPRLALHCPPVDPPEDPTQWPGDAKLSGVAVEVDDPERFAAMAGGEGAEDGAGESGEEPDGHLYRVEISEVVLTRVGDPPDHLAVRVWRPRDGLTELRAD